MANRHTFLGRMRAGRHGHDGSSGTDLPEIELIDLDEPPEPLNPRFDGAPPVADTTAGRRRRRTFGPARRGRSSPER